MHNHTGIMSNGLPRESIGQTQPGRNPSLLVWDAIKITFYEKKTLEVSWWMLCLGRSRGQNPWGLRPLGFWPWDLPRHNIHHDTSSAFSNNVPRTQTLEESHRTNALLLRNRGFVWCQFLYSFPIEVGFGANGPRSFGLIFAQDHSSLGLTHLASKPNPLLLGCKWGWVDQKAGWYLQCWGESEGCHGEGEGEGCQGWDWFIRGLEGTSYTELWVHSSTS